MKQLPLLILPYSIFYVCPSPTMSTPTTYLRPFTYSCMGSIRWKLTGDKRACQCLEIKTVKIFFCNFSPKNLSQLVGGGGTAQWKSVCLACMKSQVQFLVSLLKRKLSQIYEQIFPIFKD